MELTTGLKTNKDLASWCGITDGAFRNKKEKFLKTELPYYAEFHLNSAGKVVIDKVLDPIYDKTKGSSAAIIMEEVPKKWDESGLDTVSNVGRKIQKEYQEKDPDGKIASLALTTINNYAGRGRTKAFGSPYFHTEGDQGHCEFVWAKKITGEDGISTIVELNEEEIKIKNELIEKYYGKTQDQVLFIMEGINSGAISGREVGEALEKIAAEHKKRGSYGLLMKELKDIFGVPVVKGTRRYLTGDEEGFPELVEIQEEEE